MSDQIKLFPSDRIDALTMLYLQNQDLSNATPKEIVDKYLEAENEIKQSFKTENNQEIRY